MIYKSVSTVVAVLETVTLTALKMVLTDLKFTLADAGENRFHRVVP